MTAWTRRRIAARVDELAEQHEGSAFVDAVKRLAAELDDEGRVVLGEVLLARAGEEGGLDYALLRRIDEPRWKLFGRRPPEPEPRRD